MGAGQVKPGKHMPSGSDRSPRLPGHGVRGCCYDGVTVDGRR